MTFSTAEQYPKLVNGPPPFIFERRRVDRNKSATNMSAREVVWRNPCHDNGASPTQHKRPEETRNNEVKQ